MRTDSWDDEDEVRDDLEELRSHIEQLREKYGNRLYLFADDPFHEWAGMTIALERDKGDNKYGVRTLRRYVEERLG